VTAAARFVPDSALERAGFKLLVPLKGDASFRDHPVDLRPSRRREKSTLFPGGTGGSNPPRSSGEMVWGRRRDFLPGSQEVKWRDGNPPTNATVPAP